MRGAPFNPQGVGVLQVVAEEKKGGFWSSSCGGRAKRQKGVEGLEPTSVLDNRRSPSPPTSTSTLSSSLGGGGGGGSETAGVATVSDNPANGWPEEGGGGGGGGGVAMKEWASELQPIPDSLVEMGLLTGREKGGLGFDDWEAMFADSASQDQTFLRWITRDMDEASSVVTKQHQLLSQGAVDFDSNDGLAFGFEPIEGMAEGAFGASIDLPLASSSGFPYPCSNSNRIPASPPNQATVAPLPSVKAPNFGNLPSNLTLSAPPMNNLPLLPSLPPGLFFQETMEEKPQLNPGLFPPLPAFVDHQQPPHFVLPPQPKRHHSISTEPNCPIPQKIPFPDSGAPNHFIRRHQLQQQNQGIPQPNPIPYHLQQRPMKPKTPGEDAAAHHHHHHQQALVDQLLKAAELVEAGNSVSARGILARLNHQLPSPLGKPLLRSAFYFKEALGLVVASADAPPSSSPPPLYRGLVNPLDVVVKLGAYKAFSEVSPLLQFTNFTCVQALLEELGASDRIHIIDFDIGVGGQWSSFMQELAHRRPSATPLLKITAFISPGSHHPLELHLIRENLSHFAADLNIPFEFGALTLDPFDPAELLSMTAGRDEAIAVNLPIGSAYNPRIPTLLRLVKQLSPKIVFSVDHWCDRSDLPFSHHFLHALQSCMVLLDSIDAVGTSSDVASKIERFLLQPRIEGAVMGRHLAGDKMLPWRTLFASAGFMPMHFSNFTETQAECLLKRVQVRGFHVEKRQASLFLNWQHRELASVSAWRC